MLDMPMLAITRLKPSDSISVDSAAISALFRTHGAVIAEDILMRRVVELTDGITSLDATALEKASALDADRLRTLAALAKDTGLITLAQSLGAVVQALAADNRMALPALWERVKRIGDRSLVMLWDLPQLRM